MGTTAPLASDWIPRDGVNVKLGDRNEMAKRMYFIDQNKYSSEVGNKYSINFQYDIALMRVDTPMQFTSPSDDAEPLSVVKTVGGQKAGDKIKYTGYGISFDETKNGAGKVTNPTIQKGNLLSVTTNIQTMDGPGANGNFMKWQATTVGGFSGSSVRDSKDEIFGILQYSTHIKEPNGYGGGLKFNQKTLDWIHKVINDNKVVGWREYNGGRYYFQDNGHLYRNTTKVIDGERWEFNKKGIAKSLGKVEYGSVTIEYVDTEGKPLLNGKSLVEKDEVGANYNYNVSKDPYTSSLNSNWELKSVQQNGKDLGKNPSISGNVVAGKTVYKFVYSKKNANIKVKYTGTGQEETLDNGGKGYPIGTKVKVKPKQLTDEVNRLITHVGRQLPEDLLQEEFDEEVDRLKVRVPEVREVKAKLKIVIEEEKVRRTIAEYVKLAEEIRNVKLKVGSENKELLGNLDGLVKKRDAGNQILRNKSGITELRKVISDVRSGFNQVKESDKKTVETDSFDLTYGIRGGVNVTFTNSTPSGSVSSTGNVKDGSVSRIVKSSLGNVVDTRDTVTEKPEDKQIVVGTKNERRFVRYETKPYKVVGHGQVLVAGVTGLVEVWNINGEEVKFEVREVTDEVRG